MTYDKKNFQTRLALYKDGKVSLEEKIKLDERTSLAPLPAGNGLLENHFILFPSAVAEFESNQKLYEEVSSFIDKYVQIPDSFRALAATYVMMTWLYDRFSNIPYLRVIGLWGTGKTRVLEVVGHLSYKATLAGGSTALGTEHILKDRALHIQTEKPLLILQEVVSENNRIQETLEPLNEVGNKGHLKDSYAKSSLMWRWGESNSRPENIPQTNLQDVGHSSV